MGVRAVSGTDAGYRELLDSGGVPAEHEAAAARLGWASTGRVSELGSGQSWAGLGGLRPAEQLRSAKELREHH
jgi:hypothetical protein